jgi:hypothetical protein
VLGGILSVRRWVTFAAAATQPEPHAAQEGLGRAVGVHEGRVNLRVAAVQKGAHGRGAGRRVHRLPINIAPSTVAGRACDAGRDMMAVASMRGADSS